MAEDSQFGLDQVDIYGLYANDQSLSAEVRSAWKRLADGLQMLYEDAAEEAIAQGHEVIANFRIAGCQAGEAEALLLVARALTSLNKRKEGDRLVREHLASAKKAGDKQGEAKALLAIAEVNCDQRGSKKRDEAGVAAKGALALFQELQDTRNVAASFLVQSHISIKSKSVERDKRAGDAQTLASQARDIYRQVGDTRNEACCLHAIASAHDVIDQHIECIATAEEALDLYLDLEDPYAEAFELCCMAQWTMNHGRLQITIDYAEDALEILRAAPKSSPSQELRALQILSQAHEDRGDKTGTEAVTESLRRFQQNDNRSAEAAALDMLLRAHCDKGEYEQALQVAEDARGAFSKLGDEASEAKTAAVIAGLQLKLKRPDEALHVSNSALELVKRSGTAKQRSDLMMTMAQAYLEKQEPDEALEVCKSMQTYASQSGDVEGEADALLTAGSLYMMQDNLSEARGAAMKAQLILSEEGNAIGEGKALRLLAEIYAKQEQHKAAIRAGERSRALLRGEESAVDEAAMLFLVAQEAVQLAVMEGARVGATKPLKRHARDALEKAERYAKTAIKLCTDNAKESGMKELQGSALCSMSQVQMLRSKHEEGLKSAQEASKIFADLGSSRNQASAALLCADANRAMEKYKESQNNALEAVKHFKAADPVDEKGLEAAENILAFLKQHLAPAPQMMMMPQQSKFQGASGPLPGQMMQLQGGGEEEPASEGRVARPRARGDALDIKNLDPEMVKKRVLDLALGITGADDGEIEADTPLMEAGLTSTTAIGLRDELSKDLPGINLPVTLVFDYPSVAAMTELITEG